MADREKSNCLGGAVSALKRFIRERRAVMAPIMALALIPIILAMGMAAEMSNWWLTQTSLQHAADSAALAAAFDAKVNGSPTTVPANCTTVPTTAEAWYCQAIATAKQYNYVAGTYETVTPSAATDAAPCPSGVTGACYKVEITEDVPVYLLGILGFTGTKTIAGTNYQQVGASAVAAIITGGGGGSPVCVLSLDPTGGDDMNFSGTAVWTLTDCGVMGDSTLGTAPCGFAASGSESVTVTPSTVDIMTAASNFCVSGTATLNGTLKTSAPYIADPYKSSLGSFPPGGMSTTCSGGAKSVSGVNITVTEPAGNYTNVTVSGTGNSVTLNPGTFGYINVSAGNSLTLNAGIYYFNSNSACGGGYLNISGGATVTGSGVTLVLSNTTTGATTDGYINISGTSSTSLTASTSGTYAGFLVVSDPNLTNSGNGSWSVDLSGNTPMSLQGIIYTPKGNVDISGTNAVSGCVAMVAWNFDTSGGSSLNDDCNNAVPFPQSGGGSQIVALVQ